MSEDEELQALIESRFYENPIHRQMGFAIVSPSGWGEPGGSTGTTPQEKVAVVTMELTDDVRAAAPGTVHGGVLATLADVSCAVALTGTFDAMAEMPVTTDMHVRYYRQPRSGPLRAEARVVHAGRRIRSAECSVADAEDRVLIRATATYMMVPLDLA